uniref:Uncharacterized protein n=1 Tax=Arundo donax TaxID=35708 RepID=A0A0A9B6B9_ARUDO
MARVATLSTLSPQMLWNYCQVMVVEFVSFLGRILSLFRSTCFG